jgi:carbamoyl-phosphate synthase large subunit
MGRPHVVDAIKNGDIQLVVNTAGANRTTTRDGYQIRRAALKYAIPYATTLAGALAMARGIAALKEETLSVKPIQEYTG